MKKTNAINLEKIAITYCRISNDKSGGLDSYFISSQTEITASFCEREGYRIISAFTEVETGTVGDDGRPELAKAIEMAKKTKATLVFHKIDRAGRNAEFLLRLQNSGVEIRFADMPELRDRFTLGVLALLAEQEARNISTRTKLALRKAKEAGKVLGNPRLSEARQQATVANKQGKVDFAQRMLPIINEIKRAGVSTLDGIAKCLTARGIKTRNGGAWYAKTVVNLLTAVL